MSFTKMVGMAQIAQEIVHPAPAAFRHQHEIDRHGGDHEIAVDLAVQDQGLAVGRFIGVVGGQGLGRGRRGGAGRQRPGPQTATISALTARMH